MSQRVFAACLFATVIATASASLAQGFGSRMGSSGFGSSGFGSSSFGSGMGSSAFGGGGMGSSSFGSGFGSSGLGSSFGSGMGGVGSSGFGGGGFGSSSFGNQGLGGRSFVGRDSADMASVWGQMGQAGAQMMNQMNRSTPRSNSGSQQQAAKVEYVPQKMLVNLQVAFTPPRPSQTELSNTIRTRLDRILTAQNIAAPQLTMEGDIAVLRGVAATESQRLVLEKLIAMEPGVRAVRNEMTVVASSATESLPARN